MIVREITIQKFGNESFLFFSSIVVFRCCWGWIGFVCYHGRRLTVRTSGTKQCFDRKVFICGGKRRWLLLLYSSRQPICYVCYYSIRSNKFVRTVYRREKEKTKKITYKMHSFRCASRAKRETANWNFPLLFPYYYHYFRFFFQKPLFFHSLFVASIFFLFRLGWTSSWLNE